MTEQAIYNRLKYQTHLTLPDIIFRLCFEQSMTTKKVWLFLNKLLVDTLNKAIRHILHNDRLQGKARATRILDQGSSTRRSNRAHQLALRDLLRGICSQVLQRKRFAFDGEPVNNASFSLGKSGKLKI